MSQHPKFRLARSLSFAVCLAVVIALGGSLFRGAPQFMPEASATTNDPKNRLKDDYDLSSLEILRKVVVQIKDNYVDPKRIDPKEMFMAALEAVEKSTAEVMVDGNAKEGHVKITCGNATRDFRFDDVESIWMIPHRIKPIFAFIQDNLTSTTNKRDIEYSAINGMLSTLDPHSWLLKPDLYREMKLQTRGEFGGLGFVIAMEEDRLTVKKVLKGTPAFRAGIKKGDEISRIEDESTVNMDLNDAVSKLRGKPGTEVKIMVRRGGEDEKLYRLTRASISIESVTSQLLAGGVGYVRLSSFAGTTDHDLQQAIRDLKSQSGGKLNGLVMDLRFNPGGLLDQAIQVADEFIDEGPIVTTAGMGDKMREPKNAHNDPGDREYPVALIVNEESASASEIVAGAMKNLNRAVIIGKQTFGKGSVQVLYDLPEPGTKEEAALKLTIAQYLTPGDKSIQEIGVTPDIELLPARVTKDKVDLFAPPQLLREADLEKHFSNGFQPEQSSPKVVESPDKPYITMRYLKDEKPAKGHKDVHPEGDDDADSEDAAPEEPDEDAIASEYQVEFARQLLLAAPKTDRLGMLEAAKDFLAQRQAQEAAKVEKAIGTLGLDWTQDPQQPPAGIVAAVTDFKVSPPHPAGGDKATFTATVENTGKVPFERLSGYTRCDEDKNNRQRLCVLLDRREFLFGRVAPGEKKSWSTTVKIPNDMPATDENLTLTFKGAFNNAPEDRPVEVASVEAPEPAFAFTYQVLDRDGLAEPGESVDIRIDVRNTGTGKASKGTYVSLRNEGSEKIFIKKGRAVVGPLAPGETRSATLTLEVRNGFDATDGIPLKLEIGDRDMWQFTSGNIVLPSVPKPPAVTDASGGFRISRDETVVAAPLANAPSLAEARHGALLPLLGRAGDFSKVEWATGRVGYVRTAAGTTEANAPVKANPVAGGELAFAQQIRFSSGKDVLSNESQRTLGDLARVLNDHSDVQLEIDGHAVVKGTKDDAVELSDRRAKAVRDYLINQGHVTATRLTAKGWGQTPGAETKQAAKAANVVDFNATAGAGTEVARATATTVVDSNVTAVMQREPPFIALSGIETAKSALVVDGDHYKLNGTAKDNGGIQDVRVFVNNEKVFFRTSAGPQADGAPKTVKGATMKLPFSADIPLKTGNNTVIVVARQDDDFLSQRTIIIHRLAPELAQGKPPPAKNE